MRRVLPCVQAIVVMKAGYNEVTTVDPWSRLILRKYEADRISCTHYRTLFKYINQKSAGVGTIGLDQPYHTGWSISRNYSSKESIYRYVP